MARTPKNIVICSDGTGNRGGKARGTNVWRLYSAVDQSPTPPRGRRRQIAFHDDGVGTEKLRYVRAITSAFGLGISRNLRRLYAFLIQNYEQGDDVYLFGFSRGAFTVRVLASMITVCGLPSKYERDGRRKRERTPTEIAELARQALRAYKRRCWKWLDQPRRFKEEHSRDESGKPREVPIRCVGVWDTVDAVGLPIDELTAAFSFLFPLRFADQELSANAEAGLHALSIDDERLTFHPVLWEPAPHIEQVWFAGVHSNVGGGYPKDQLSLITLNWMMERVQKLEPDAARRLRFHPALVNQYRQEALLDGQLYDSRTGLAAYYRYAPRRLDRLGAPTALTRGLTQRGASQLRPRVHTSVLWRIYEETDGYAPTAIPQDYELADDSGFRATKLPARESNAEKRARHLELAHDLVWWRRLLYFGLLAWTLWMVLAGWVFSLEPIPVDRGYTAGVLGALVAVLPGPLDDIVVGYQKYPVRFWLYLGAYLALWFWNRHLRLYIADIAVDAWHMGFGQEILSGWRGLRERLRSNLLSAGNIAVRLVIDLPAQRIARFARALVEAWRAVPMLRRASDAFEWVLVPLAAAALLLGLVGARPAWNYHHRVELTPRLSLAPERIEASAWSIRFDARNPLHATGWKLIRGERYGIEVAADAPAGAGGKWPWRDATWRGGPAGLADAWQGDPAMWGGILLRRVVGAPWFQLRGVIVTRKGERVGVAIGKGTDFVAPVTGELFLFVNDVPGRYGNNQGTATVTITHWPRGKVPQAASAAAGQ